MVIDQFVGEKIKFTRIIMDAPGLIPQLGVLPPGKQSRQNAQEGGQSQRSSLTLAVEKEALWEAETADASFGLEF